MADIQGMMNQMRKLQERMAEVQSKLEQRQVTSESGGGMVKVTANGKQQIIGIEIEKEVISPDEKEMLEDLVMAAVNTALEDSQKMAQEEMGKVTAGMMPKIPGMNLPGF